jgi:RHS repeat-associated protein
MPPGPTSGVSRATPTRILTPVGNSTPETGLYCDRHRMYSAQLGRFASRDPVGYIGSDAGLFTYVLSDPLSSSDPSGLWKPPEHLSQTGHAFVSSNVAESWSRNCRRIALNVIEEANVGQDFGSAPGGPSSDPGEQNYRHFVRRPRQGPDHAIAEYHSYLGTEECLFKSSVATATSESCLEALRALGRLTHSWQDFYAHAVRRKPPMLPLWGTGTETGDPRRPTFGVKPPSWSWPFGGEHGLSEPAERDGENGAQLRRADAVSFVVTQYRTMLPPWYEVCRCYCERWVIRSE